MTQTTMASEHSKALNLTGAVLFDDRTALHLTQAFHQEESLESLLALLMSQLTTLCQARGLIYRNDDLQLQVELGEVAHNAHHVDYNLDYKGTSLGEMNVYFTTRQNDHDLQTCEDLIALVFTALRQNIRYLELTDQKLQQTETADAGTSDAGSLSKEEKADALILVALDGYQAMRTRDGEEWTQILMSSVHTQIKDGLRQADGVYQISDELIAVLLPNTTMHQATEVAGKIRVLVSSLHLTGETDTGQLTASMGISDAKLARTAEEVMGNAKIALAQAQDRGINTILAYDESLASELGIG